MYPRYNAALGDAMMQELALFTDYVVRKGDGLLKTLLTSNLAFPQGGLFSIYGVTQPSGFTVGTPVTLDATQRAGILTQAAFLTRWAHGNQTSPVHRGKLVRLNVMCGYIPPPPANVNTTPPAPTAATSTRERFAQHQADPKCSPCHQMMDPIGLGFETFDGIGAFRTMDGLGPVDATGNIVDGGDLDGAFNGPVELAKKLSESTGRFELHGEPVVPLLDGSNGDHQRRLFDSGRPGSVHGVGGQHSRDVGAHRAESFLPQRPPHSGELDHHGA